MGSESEHIEQDPPGGSYDVEPEVVERLTDDDSLEQHEKPE